MKKLLCICLSMLLLFIVGISAYAFGPEPESTCSVVEYDQTISGEAQFRSTEFTCVKGNGDFLSYGFDNTADADCMVELYKKGLIWDTKVSSMTVRPHDPGGKQKLLGTLQTAHFTLSSMLRMGEPSVGICRHISETVNIHLSS